MKSAFSGLRPGDGAEPRLRPLLLGALALALAAFTAMGAARAGVFEPDTFTLDNGLEVVVIENSRLPVVRQMVFYRVGAADDPFGKSGLAHYLEHLMFKGTETIPPGEFSKIVARHGGRDNAFTSSDTTAYYQTVAKQNLELVMKIEADRMANLVIDDGEAAPELQVVLEERRARTDNRPGAQLNEQISNALYMHHPYRIPIIGWRHELETLTPEDARRFYARHYAPNNAILVLAGDITLDEARPLAEKYYGPIPANPVLAPRDRLQEPPHRAARRVTMTSDQVAEARFSREYLASSHTTGVRDPDGTRHGHALEVLSDILGGGPTSRLYRALVIEQKLALSAGTYYDGDVLGPSHVGFYIRPRKADSIAEVEAALDAEIAKIRAEGITAEELAAAKKRLLAGAVFARDHMRHGATVIGMARAIGLPIEHVEQWPERISAVTVDDVQAAAEAVFREEQSVTGLLLPAASTDSSDAQPRTVKETGQETDNMPVGGTR